MSAWLARLAQLLAEAQLAMKEAGRADTRPATADASMVAAVRSHGDAADVPGSPRPANSSADLPPAA